MEKHLHIICHDVPYPVDYGGVFDLFYKIKTLHQLGIKIHLHCFEYGRGQQPYLNQFCDEVLYYSRNEGHKGFSIKLPYIVCSRTSPLLHERLLKDDYPILLEGIHCTSILNDDRFSNRNIILRLHNVEYAYYYQLYKHEKNVFKKAYYLNESRLLKVYEKSIANKVKILAVAPKDVEEYKTIFGATNIEYLPVSIPFTDVKFCGTNGSYCLYHGNLSVAENEKAALWLLENVFNTLKIPFVIAGKNPSAKLERMAHIHSHTCLVANPGETEMQDMIAKAQINILPSFNQTGIKLKILNALYNGKHCIVNDAAIEASGLEECCIITATAEECKAAVSKLFSQPFHHFEAEHRQQILSKHFDNNANAKRLIALIW